MYNYLVELGADINNNHSILDIIICQNWHQDCKFRFYYEDGQIDVVEKLNKRLENHDSDLEIFLWNDNFIENLENIVGISRKKIMKTFVV